MHAVAIATSPLGDRSCLVHAGPRSVAPDVPVTSCHRVGWSEIPRDRTADGPVLDVRRSDEFAAAHVTGGGNLPLHELLCHPAEIPDGRLWGHCGSGYRAGVVAAVVPMGPIDLQRAL